MQNNIDLTYKIFDSWANHFYQCIYKSDKINNRYNIPLIISTQIVFANNISNDAYYTFR